MNFVRKTASKRKKPDGACKGVPALLRGSKVMDAVVASEQPVTVSDLARQLKLPKSTVHGLCSTLVDLGLLSRRNAGLVVGPHVMRWANAFLAKSNLTSEFYDLSASDTALSDETFTLSVLDGAEVVYIACRNSGSQLGITFRIGMRLPAPFTATGKAILSTMSDPEVRALLAGPWPEQLTPRSVSDIDGLLKELAGIRRRGYSVDDGQTREGMFCFGTTVRDSSDAVVAGIAISLLAAKVDASTTALAADCVQALADQLSRRLGADVTTLAR